MQGMQGSPTHLNRKRNYGSQLNQKGHETSELAKEEDINGRHFHLNFVPSPFF